MDDNIMKIVYIAHPIAGDIFYNKLWIKQIIRKLNLTEPDIVPFAPYLVDLDCLHDEIPKERQRGIKNNTALLRAGFVDELWLYGTTISPGMICEIQLANELNIPVIAKTDGTKKDLEKLKINELNDK